VKRNLLVAAILTAALLVAVFAGLTPLRATGSACGSGASGGSGCGGGGAPAGRVWAAWAYDPLQRDIVLFGGNSGVGGSVGTSFGDTWTWTLRGWAERHPAASPSARTGAAMAYDQATGQLLLFGGSSSEGPPEGFLNDTWIWNGTTWIHLHPAVSPPARRNADMVYDATRHQLLLFGGFGGTPGGSYFGDTWTWNGSTWTQLHPAASPGPRDTGSLVYDRATRTPVAYGGWNGVIAADDTWVFGLRTWTLLHPATTPGSQGFAWQAGYDPATGQLIAYGGLFIGTATWDWNGTTWTQLHPASTPGPRGYGTITYDPALHALVLFAGTNGRTDPVTVWGWTGTTWHAL